MTLTTFIILYSLGALFTGILFWYINYKYFHKQPTTTKVTNLIALVLGLFWPCGLPAFVWIYRPVIRSVIAGRDWVDDSDANEDVKKLLRMGEQEARDYVAAMEERFARQIVDGTYQQVQPIESIDKGLN